VVGCGDELKRLADHLLLAIAEQPPRRAVERFDHAVLAGRDDRVRDVLEHRPRADLALAQRGIERRDRGERALQLLRLAEEVDEGGDLGPQDLREDRREDEVDRAARVRVDLLGLVAAEGGEEDDRRVLRLLALADQLPGLVAVHDRHASVHEDRGEALAQHGAHRCLP
jgi:hypothetical protein